MCNLHHLIILRGGQYYKRIAPVFTIDDNAGSGTLSAGSTVTLSGTMTLQGNNHRDYWDDRLVLVVGTGNGLASQNHPYANRFGYAGGNDKVYALGVSISPLGSPIEDGSRPTLKVIDAQGRRDVTSASTRRSPTLVWDFSITLASTWKDYTTGDNPDQDNGRGIERHEHSYTLKLDLDYDEAFETMSLTPELDTCKRNDNTFIANWTNTGFIKDYGWKKILETIGDHLSYIDFHTYWWVYGGSWGLNDPVNPQTNELNPEYGVSTWEAWKSQLPMQWENIDNDSHDYFSGSPLSVQIGSALTQETSLAEYFRTVRQVLDDNNFEDIKIMIGEWGVAPRGHSRLDPNRYQLTVMLAKYFMQMISSGSVAAAAGWPFSSRGEILFLTVTMSCTSRTAPMK